ncbi:MAG TPA: isocitrate/isopropylmalate family dehydrogenase [Streptosporangiaceae bacterium]|jgi:tartrate dehydrogenase/decarboxylase/D-malate dehydrogenase
MTAGPAGPGRRIRVAVIGGDGIGPEVTAATLPVLAAAAALDGAVVDAEQLDWGGDRYLRTGQAMPGDGPELLRGFDGVLFGAVGRPDVPDHELIWGLILALRQRLGLALNLRPAQFWPGARSPLARPDGIDLLIVRENTEGEYAGIGGRSQQGRPGEVAIEVAVHSRAVIEKIARFSFERARRRRGGLALVTKSNVLRYGYTLWDEVTAQVAADYPDVTCEVVLADAMAARLVERPAGLDVLLCGNLFGDVLSDLACSLTGGLGLAPSANVPYDRSAPGVYEPVHGSAPDIAGRGIANPCACALSAAMLADDLDLPRAAGAIRAAVAATLARPGERTPDVGGTATTAGVAAALLARVTGAGSGGTAASGGVTAERRSS